MRTAAAAALTAALALAACDDPAYLYSTATVTRIDGADVTTTLQVGAVWAEGGHGDSVSHARTGLAVAGGPSPGALQGLVESPPGVYTAVLAGAPPAVHYRFEGHDYLNDAPHLDAAAITAGAGHTATVTWSPPVDALLGDDAVQVSVIAPSGASTTFGCGAGTAVTGASGDSLVLEPCALPESGRYLVTVRRESATIGDETSEDFLYSWASFAVERVLTLDVP